MGNKKIWKAAWMFAAFLASLVISKGEASAAGTESQEAQTLQSYIEDQGLFYGEYGDCMYTYTNQDKEVKIIGLNEKAEKIKLPSKIDGKKVTVIDLVPRSRFDTDEYALDLRVKKITFPKYINKITVVLLRDHTSPKLKEYRVSPKNQKFMAKDGVLFSKNGKKLISFPANKRKETYQIAEGVTTIGEEAFRGCGKIQNIVMADTVKTIKDQAFYYSSIRTIALSKNLQSLGGHVFNGTEITEITIPPKVRTIPEFCFESCKKLKKATIEQGVKRIAPNAFRRCTELRKVFIPPSVTDFDSGAFVYFSSHVKTKKVNLTIYAKEGSYAYKVAKESGEYGIKVRKWEDA